MTVSRRASVLLVLGFTLVQLSWALAVPPFRGIDEFDHIYRAAAVAHGQIRAYDEPVADGRGDYVRVPAHIVEDAGPICRSYAYTGPDNCRAVAELDDGFVKVASAAARYHPAYYAVVGGLASPWAGTDFVLAARIVTLTLCSLLWGLAVLAARRTSNPRRAHLTLALIATPILTYSGSMAAPNGLEVAAAVATWLAFIAFPSARSLRDERLLIGAGALAACVLVTVRTLGPVWMLLIVATVVLLPQRRERLAVLARHRVATMASVVAVGTCTAGSIWWVLSSQTNALSQEDSYNLDNPWGNALTFLPLWILQSVAAFPVRNERAPVIVYACVLVALLVAYVALGRWSSNRWRNTALGMILVWLVPPYVFEGLTYSTMGGVWQGRYSMPYLVGLALALLIWPGPSRDSPLTRVLPLIGLVTYAVANVVSVVNVLRMEQISSPLANDPRWWVPPELLIAGLLVAGTVLQFLPAFRRRERLDPEARPRSTSDRVLANEPS